jgi:hypothetical protein
VAPTTSRTYVFSQPEGIIAVRAVEGPPAQPPTPVAIDVATFVAATGKVVHRTPKKIPPFSLSRGFGEARLVDGGVLLQTGTGEPVHFLRDDGKEDIFSIPKGEGIGSAMRIGKRWLLIGNGSSTRLTFSDDGGQSWTTKLWRLEDRYALWPGTIAGKPYLEAIGRPATETRTTETLFSLDTIGDDPPLPLVVEPTPGPVACEGPLSGIRAAGYMSGSDQMLSMLLDGKPPAQPRALSRVTHPTAAGGRCTTAYEANDWIVFLDREGYSGVLFEAVAPAKTAKTARVVHPLTCTPPK